MITFENSNKSRMIPYESAQEFLTDSKIHGPYFRFRSSLSEFISPVRVNHNGVMITLGIAHGMTNDMIGYSYSYDTLLKETTWQDGTPCGKYVK